jgi:hypothetical protein
MQGDGHVEEVECLISGLPSSLLEDGEGEDGSSMQCSITLGEGSEENGKKQKADNAESEKKVMRAAAS